jgi:hypothetical protein
MLPPYITPAAKIKEKLLRPALTSHYQCWFNPPEITRNWIITNRDLNYNFNSELISLSCSEASLPGSSMMTNEIIDDYTGVTERPAYRRQYDDRSDFTFYVDHGRSDGNYNVLWFFESWLAHIVDEKYTEGLENSSYFYRVNFPIDYQSPALYLNKFERDYKGQYLEYRFLQAYPISISSMPVSYESSQLLKCTVSFTYTRYVVRRKRNNVSISGIQEPRQSTAPGVPDPSKASIIAGSETMPGIYDYELSSYPGQFSVPRGQGGASDLLDPGVGAIGRRTVPIE